MEQVGTVAQLWRYPVKSMAGETVTSADLGPLGMRTDRRWALRDEQTKEIWSARNLHVIAQCAAHYVREPQGQDSGPVAIKMPNGSVVESSNPEAGAKISAALGHPLSLWPVVDPTNLPHYRRKARDEAELGQYLVEQFARLPGEPFPDLSKAPPEAMEFVSQPGTYRDVAPLHVLTTASLEHMAKVNPAAQWDVKRFRPNIVVKTPPELTGLIDAKWVNRVLAIGEARIPLVLGCFRCAMPTLAMPGLPKDPSVLRTIVHEGKQDLGLYAAVAQPGTVRVGDPVYLI
jgi:uncharacterized protein